MKGPSGYQWRCPQKTKWAEGSNSEAEGAVNSADLRNPKKARQQAAFNMTESGLVVESQILNNLLRMGGVMGSLGRVWFPAAAWARFIPLSTYSSLGNSLPAKGSSNPIAIWVWRRPDM